MRRLILLRHGEAERSAASGSDYDRALTARGREDARAAGRWLAERGLKIDLALVSPAVRARQTWAEAAEAFPACRAEIRNPFYAADPGDMLAAARASEDDTIALVAHNPGLHTLALDLMQAGVAAPRLHAAVGRGLPPAAVVVFELSEQGAVSGGLFHAPERVSA